MYIYLFQILFHFRLLQVISILTRAIEEVLVVYLLHIYYCVYGNPKLLVYPSPTLGTMNFFSVSSSLFQFCLLAVLSLCCCTWAFSRWHEEGYSLAAVHGLLVVVASRCGAWTLDCSDSVVVACGVSCLVACGIFLEQRLNLCPLHWQVDS